MVAGRSRSKSIVQETALDISFIEDTLDEENENKLQRSRSLDTEYRHPQRELTRTFPFSEKEKSQLWASHIGSHKHDLLIPEDQLDVVYDIENEKFILHRDTLEKQSKICKELLKKTNGIIVALDDLALKYDKVLKETSDFQTQSTSLMDEHTKLVVLGDSIDENLKYFESLDSIQRVLNTAGSNLVKKQSFKNALIRLDECLEFCHQNPSFKEVEIYSIRFRQCMTRSLTLIRNYLITYLKTIHTDIDSKLNKDKVGSITNEALIINEFSSKGEKFKELVYDITSRVQVHDEYSGLLSDILTNYFKIRSNLLHSFIWNHLDETILSKKNLVQFAQDNVSFFTSLCNKEYDIFTDFFFNTSYIELDQLDQWFKSLCEPLYDTCRNKIIRETDIEVLCQFATLFQKYYEFEDDGFSTVGDENASKINFGELFQPILQDIQARLVFRVQVYIDENIVNYKPTPEDLKIGGRRSIKQEPNETGESPEEMPYKYSDNLDKDYSNNLFKDWYPPLGKAISILSTIYQLVNSVVFDDLAHYIVHVSIGCLRTAYNLASVHLGKLDAELYMMQHLILLRNQIQTFDIQYVRRETTFDFSGLTDIFESIRGGTFTGSNFLNLARDSVPKVVNNMVDAKFEVQTELRNIVHQFTEDAVNKIVEPLTETNPATAIKDNLAFRENIETQLPRLNSEMHIFIQDDQVIHFLLEGIQDLILQTYENYHERLFEMSAEKSDVQDIMEVDALIGFITGIASSFYINLQKPEMLNLSDDEFDVSD